MASYNTGATTASTADFDAVWTALLGCSKSATLVLSTTEDWRRRTILDAGLYLVKNNFSDAKSPRLGVSILKQVAAIVVEAQKLDYLSIGKQDGDQDGFKALASAMYKKDATLSELRGDAGALHVNAGVDLMGNAGRGYPSFSKDLTSALLPFFQSVHTHR